MDSDNMKQRKDKLADHRELMRHPWYRKQLAREMITDPHPDYVRQLYEMAGVCGPKRFVLMGGRAYGKRFTNPRWKTVDKATVRTTFPCEPHNLFQLLQEFEKLSHLRRRKCEKQKDNQT